jgi:hypothetical protein
LIAAFKPEFFKDLSRAAFVPAGGGIGVYAFFSPLEFFYAKFSQGINPNGFSKKEGENERFL